MVPEIWSMTSIIFCHLGPCFAVSPHEKPDKLKFWKSEKSIWRWRHFTLVYHKWQSYVYFLRYGVQGTEFFCHFGPPPPKNPEFKILKKWKNAWRYYHLTHVYHKWQSYVWFLRNGVQQTEFCFSLGHFLLF